MALKWKEFKLLYDNIKMNKLLLVSFPEHISALPILSHEIKLKLNMHHALL